MKTCRAKTVLSTWSSADMLKYLLLLSVVSTVFSTNCAQKGNRLGAGGGRGAANVGWGGGSGDRNRGIFGLGGGAGGGRGAANVRVGGGSGDRNRGHHDAIGLRGGVGLGHRGRGQVGIGSHDHDKGIGIGLGLGLGGLGHRGRGQVGIGSHDDDKGIGIGLGLGGGLGRGHLGLGRGRLGLGLGHHGLGWGGRHGGRGERRKLFGLGGLGHGNLGLGQGKAHGGRGGGRFKIFGIGFGGGNGHGRGRLNGGVTLSADADDGLRYGVTGCRNNPTCMELVKRAGIRRKYWFIKWGFSYKGLTRTSIRSLRECIEKCFSSGNCFMLSWWDNTCYIQENGDVEGIKLDNLEVRPDALTLLGRKRHLRKWRKFKLGKGKGKGRGKGEGERSSSGSSDSSDSDDHEAKYGELGCQGIQECIDLVNPLGERRFLWLFRWKTFYRDLVDVSPKTPSECLEECFSNLACLVFSWGRNNVCFIQQDGDAAGIKPGNLEERDGFVTFLARVKRLARMRKFGSAFGVGGSFGFGENGEATETGNGGTVVGTGGGGAPGGDVSGGGSTEVVISGGGGGGGGGGGVIEGGSAGGSSTVIKTEESQSCALLLEDASYKGNDMVASPQTTADACHKYCEDNAGCAACTFRPNSDPKCSVLISSKTPTQDDFDFESGAASFLKTGCEGGYAFNQTESCVGNIANATYTKPMEVVGGQSTADDCENYCINDPKCQATSFSLKPPVCKAVHGEGFVSEDDFDFADGVVSFYKASCSKKRK